MVLLLPIPPRQKDEEKLRELHAGSSAGPRTVRQVRQQRVCLATGQGRFPRAFSKTSQKRKWKGNWFQTRYINHWCKSIFQHIHQHIHVLWHIHRCRTHSLAQLSFHHAPRQEQLDPGVAGLPGIAPPLWAATAWVVPRAPAAGHQEIRDGQMLPVFWQSQCVEILSDR